VARWDRLSEPNKLRMVMSAMPFLAGIVRGVALTVVLGFCSRLPMKCDALQSSGRARPIMIPTLGSCHDKMTLGERRVAERLSRVLDEEAIIWYDTPIGPRCQKPDFCVLHPLHGIIVLEVKDWKFDRIESCNPTAAILKDPEVTVPNPLAQARGYAEAISSLLQRDPLLTNPPGHRYSGRLAFPYGYGVILANITRKQFEKTELHKVIEPSHLFCKDDLSKSVDPELLRQRFLGLPHYSFGNRLTKEQVERIRFHMFPDIRIDPGEVEQESEAEVEEWHSSLNAVDIVRMMDLSQEQLARSLGDGHRIIHGVAGSGKTIIMLCRVETLAKTTNNGPLLILCFNVVLAAKLDDVMRQRGLSGRVTVKSFHRWCQSLLYQHHLPLPVHQTDGGEYARQLFSFVERGVEEGRIPKGTYAHISIDEGHDFQPEWLALIVDQVSKDTESLLLLYDDAQNIYGRKQQRATKRFSFRSVGIKAQGRTSILNLNYRNTQEILGFAYTFLSRHVLVGEEVEESGEDGLLSVPPATAGRHGPPPELVRVGNNRSEECDYIVSRCREYAEEGVHWEDIAILYRNQNQGRHLAETLERSGVPVEWCNRNSSSRQYKPNDPSVKLVTMHSSKGLEFPVVLMPAIDEMTRISEDEVRLLYIGMTRAIERLVITYKRKTPLVNQLLNALVELRMQ